MLENILAEVKKHLKSEFAVSVRYLVQATLENLEQDALVIISDENMMVGIEEVVILIQTCQNLAKVTAAGVYLFWHLFTRSGQLPDSSASTKDDALQDLGVLEYLNEAIRIDDIKTHSSHTSLLALYEEVKPLYEVQYGLTMASCHKSCNTWTKRTCHTRTLRLRQEMAHHSNTMAPIFCCLGILPARQRQYPKFFHTLNRF